MKVVACCLLLLSMSMFSHAETSLQYALDRYKPDHAALKSVLQSNYQLGFNKVVAGFATNLTKLHENFPFNIDKTEFALAKDFVIFSTHPEEFGNMDSLPNYQFSEWQETRRQAEQLSTRSYKPYSPFYMPMPIITEQSKAGDSVEISQTFKVNSFDYLVVHIALAGPNHQVTTGNTDCALDFSLALEAPKNRDNTVFKVLSEDSWCLLDAQSNSNFTSRHFKIETKSLSEIDLKLLFTMQHNNIAQVGNQPVVLHNFSVYGLSDHQARTNRLVGNSLPLLKNGKVYGMLVINSDKRATLVKNLPDHHGRAAQTSVTWRLDEENNALLFGNYTQRFALTNLQIKSGDLSDHILAATVVGLDDTIIPEFEYFNAQQHHNLKFHARDLSIQFDLPEQMQVNKTKIFLPEISEFRDFSSLYFRPLSTNYAINHLLIQPNGQRTAFVQLSQNLDSQMFQLLPASKF